MGYFIEKVFFAMTIIISLLICVGVMILMGINKLLNSGGNDVGIDIDWSERLIPAKQGWARSLTNVLENDPDFIYTTDAAGETIFHVLARAGDTATILKMIKIIKERQIMRILLKQNINGDTALHLALKNRHPITAYWLDEANVRSAFVKNKEGIRPRDLACLAGYDTVLSERDCAEMQGSFADLEMRWAWEKFFVEPEVKVKWIKQIPKGLREVFLKACDEIIKPKQIQKELDEYGGNLLHIAARLGSEKLLSLLVPCKSSELTSLAFEKDLHDCTPLHLAIKNEKKAAAMLLIQVAPATAYWDRKGGSPLYLAIKKGYLDLVLQIFHHLPGTDIDSSTRKQLIEAKKTSIVYAAIRARSQSSSSNDMLRTIMKELPGCIDSINKKGWRPLSYAAFKGYSDEVSYFLNNFPDSALKPDIDGSFPIHKAVCAGHLEIIKQFLSLCPLAMDVIDTETGGSILHFAFRYRKKKGFLLLNQGKKCHEDIQFERSTGKNYHGLSS